MYFDKNYPLFTSLPNASLPPEPEDSVVFFHVRATDRRDLPAIRELLRLDENDRVQYQHQEEMICEGRAFIVVDRRSGTIHSVSFVHQIHGI